MNRVRLAYIAVLAMLAVVALWQASSAWGD